MSFLSSYKHKKYKIKFMDEQGDCYYEYEVVSVESRNAYIKQWKEKEKVTQYKVGDINVFVKNSGEELWVYEM